MKKLLLNFLLMLTSFAAYSAEESKGEPSQTETTTIGTLPEDTKTHIISFLPQNHLQQLLDANLINPKPTLNKTLEGHTNRVGSIAYSPDGSQLASGSNDNTIKIWNPQTGECLHTLTGHINMIPRIIIGRNRHISAWVKSIAYSPDGSQLASGSRDNTVKIWNPQTGTYLHTLTGHTYDVNSIAYSPDGSQLASGSDDTTVKIWNPQTGECLHTFTDHTRRVHSIAYSPDGSQLVSASGNKTIKIWNLQTKKNLHTLTGHKGTITSVAYSPDGSQLASGSRGPDNAIKIWNPQTGACLRTLTGHKTGISAIAYSPNGSQLASGSLDGAIKIWNTQTGECLYTFTAHIFPVFCVAYSRDGSQLASGSYRTSGSLDGIIKIWNVLPNFTLSAQQNALLFKITQTALASHNEGTFRRLQFKNPEDIETYATFPEELQKILEPVVAYSPVNSHSNETEHGTAHATSASASSRK